MLLSYARVSTVRQGDGEKISVPDQLRKNRAIAQLRGVDRFDICEYVDSGVSGGLAFTKREKGGQLWSEMKPGDVVVAAKLDRMFRSARDALNMLERFREAQVKVILADLSIEPIGDSPVTEALFGMMAIFANLERRMINDRTANGKLGKRAKGGYLGGFAPPYGWRVEGEGKDAMLVAEPAEQAAVAKVITWRDQGVSYRGISSRLAEEGITTRNGTPFFVVQVKRCYDYEMKRREWNEAA